MGASARKKTQHFVPRLVLRGFSRDEASIDLVLLKSSKRVSKASIGDQCARNSFYGPDNTIEDALSQIEGAFSQIVGDLSPLRLANLGEHEVSGIVFFVHVQRSRTVAAGEAVSAAQEGLLKQMATATAHLNNEEINLNGVRISIPRPQLQSLHFALTNSALVSDLDVKFIVTNKKPGFVLSDDPVALCNQWAQHHELFRRWPANTGLAHKGLQLFMPISTEVTIAVFDPTTYEYGSPRSRICIPSVRDIRALNDLQAMHARECIYYDKSETPESEVDRVVEMNRRHSGWRAPRVFESPFTRTEGKISQMVAVRNPSPRIAHKFGFVRVVDPNSYEGWNVATIPMRSPELVEINEAIHKRRKDSASAIASR